MALVKGNISPGKLHLLFTHSLYILVVCFVQQRRATMWAGINRRKFPRVDYNCRIYIRKKDSTKTISTHTENIGAGGICVILEEGLSLFQGVALELDVKNGVPASVKCSGTVVWVVRQRDARAGSAMRYDTGIEFVDIGEEDTNRISKVVEKQLKEAKK